MLSPLNDKIIVLADEAEKVTEGGIEVPEIARKRPQFGKVMAVGPGKRTDSGKVVPLALKPGDRVAYGQNTGTEILYKKVTYIVMAEGNAFATDDNEPWPKPEK